MNDFRAQLLRQFGGDGGGEASPMEQMLTTAMGSEEMKMTIADKLAEGQVLIAHPQRFCSGNPFSRPVKDMGRFGLQGPRVGPRALAGRQGANAAGASSRGTAT